MLYSNLIFGAASVHAGGFPGSTSGKESACSVRDLGLIPVSGRYPGEGNGNSLQYSSLENTIDRVTWQAAVHRVTKSGTQLSDYHLLTYINLI